LDIPQGFTASELSPYFHEVRFGSVSPGSGGYYGQILFYASIAIQTSSVDVTGWKIEANHGSEYVPQAVNVYGPLVWTPQPTFGSKMVTH